MSDTARKVAEEMLAEAGGDIGQEFPAATNTQLRAWAERLLAAEKERRNFDRYDTPEEAQAAFFRLCNGRHSCGPHCWYHPIDLKAACSFRFLYDTKPHDWSDVAKGVQA